MDMAGGGGGGPGGPDAASPVMPGAIQGGPSGPGASQAASPGPGAGKQAAADGMIANALTTFHSALSAYPIGSEKYKAVLAAITSLSKPFAAEGPKRLVASSIAQQAQQANSGQPMKPGVPPGILQSAMSGRQPPGMMQ
jgi:hypothetical protein